VHPVAKAPVLSAPPEISPPLVNDPAREATDTMRGYSYQVLRSVLAWSQLDDDEVLYLEGAEDLDRVRGDEVLVEQVKDTAGSGNVTLRTQGVVEELLGPPSAQSGAPHRLQISDHVRHRNGAGRPIGPRRARS
jgi:hypothetical protein